MNELLLGLADDELIIGWRDSEWTGIAPMLEEDVAFSSIAQNEIGHARAVYELLSDDADALAFDRKPEEYRCAPLVELHLLDWGRTIARLELFMAASHEPELHELLGQQVSGMTSVAAAIAAAGDGAARPEVPIATVMLAEGLMLAVVRQGLPTPKARDVVRLLNSVGP